MAGFTRTHGDSQPVFAMDTLNGPIASTTNANGTTTNFIGPGMDFFGFDLGAAPTSQLGVDGAISAVNQCIEQLGTVMMYSVSATSNTTIRRSISTSWMDSSWSTNSSSCFRHS